MTSPPDELRSSSPETHSPNSHHYRDGTLTITPDKITSTVGPVSLTADYVVKSVEGKNVRIEVGLPDPKVTLDVQVEKDFIRIGTKHLIAGVWKKAKP